MPTLLLINPPPAAVNIHFTGHQAAFPPLALFNLAAAVCDSGWQVDLMDLFRHRLSNISIRARISALRPRVVGITAMIPNNSIIEIAALVREAAPEALIVLGGAFATSYSRPILTSDSIHFDFIVRGEGEYPLRKLLQLASRTDSPKLIKQRLGNTIGFAYSSSGQVVENGIHINQSIEVHNPYSINQVWANEYDRILLQASRGCPFECKFCASTRFYGRKVRIAPAQALVDEIAVLFRNLGKRDFAFLDDIFGIKRNWTDTFFDLMESEQLDGIRLWIGTRADVLNLGQLTRARSIGLQGISVGLESVHSSTQHAIGKNLDIAIFEEFFRRCKDLGLSTETGIILGLPHESSEMIRKTIDFVSDLDPTTVHVATLQLLPGTIYFERMSEFGFQQRAPIEQPEDLFSPLSYVVGGPFFLSPSISTEELAALKCYAADCLDLRHAEYRSELMKRAICVA